MNYIKLIAVLGAMYVSSTVFAESMNNNVIIPNAWTRVITLSIGPDWTNPGQTQTFHLQPDIQKTYAANNNMQTIYDGEIFFGLQYPLTQRIQWQLGLAVAATTNVQLNGDIWEDANINFNNYSYNYDIQHTRAAVKTKLLFDLIFAAQPYLSGSAGIGFNNAHNFTITPKIFQEIPAPLFASNTTTAFTYTLGAGLQKSLVQHWQVGIGYEFADWGRSSLSPAPGQTQGNGVQLSSLYTHQLQLSLSFIA